MASAWGKAWGAAFAGAWGALSELVQTPTTVNNSPIKPRRKAVRRIRYILPEEQIDLIAAPAPFLSFLAVTPAPKTIRAKNKRDEFFILH